MATAASRDIRKQLSSIAECSVCCETFSDPRQLPCIHTYCLKCIRGFSRDKLPGDEVPCPLCRKGFTIPDGGVGSLPKNFFVQQLMDIASPMSTRCQGCSEEGSEQSDAKLAVKFCVECSERLCESCVDSHRRVKVTRTHKLVELSGDGELMEKMRSKTIYCDKHTEIPSELYCFECKNVICMMCFVELHQSHKCSDVKKVAVEFQTQMTGDIKNMRETVVSCRKLIKGREDGQVEFNRKMDVTEKEICDRVDKLKQLIDAEKANLLKELSAIRTERNKQMNNVVGEIEQHVSFIESMITYTEQLRDKGTASDVVQQTNALHIRAGELMKLDVIHQAINNLHSDDVTFTPAPWPSQSRGSSVVGEILKKFSQVTPKPSTEPSSSPVATPNELPAQVGKFTQHAAATRRTESKSPTLKHVIPSDGRRVAGLTFINNELFVLRYPSEEEIQVYETATFTQQRTVRVAGLSDRLQSTLTARLRYNQLTYHKSLTSCDVNNCLFVCDQCNVYKVNLSTNNVINWQVDGWPRGLSVNDARHVIVTCHHGNEIREYKQTGKLIRTIKLQESHVTDPRHAVQLNESMFIVSHWGPVHGVSLIDTRGRVTATYRNSESTQLLNWPRQLTVGKNGSVLVVDCNNNRLIVLDTSLKNARGLTLPIDGGLNRPGCLYFNESLRQLYVGEEDGRRVILCDNVSF